MTTGMHAGRQAGRQVCRVDTPRDDRIFTFASFRNIPEDLVTGSPLCAPL